MFYLHLMLKITDSIFMSLFLSWS